MDSGDLDVTCLLSAVLAHLLQHLGPPLSGLPDAAEGRAGVAALGPHLDEALYVPFRRLAAVDASLDVLLGPLRGRRIISRLNGLRSGVDAVNQMSRKRYK